LVKFQTLNKEMYTPDPNCVASGESSDYPSHYRFFPATTPQTVGWDGARIGCQALGPFWDLAIINNNDELFKLAAVVENECWSHMAFWMGFKEFNTQQNEDGTTSEGTVEKMAYIDF